MTASLRGFGWLIETASIAASIAASTAAFIAAAIVASVAGCASTPPPDWQLDAHAALDRAVAAQLEGNDRVAALDFDRGRGALARTGRVDLVARGELLRCAARLASLQFERCDGFEPLRADAPAAERAYADYLQGPLADAGRIALLPAAQRAAAAASGADPAVLRAIADPLSRLVAAAVWLRDGRASPAVLAVAVDTASAQGWRRPLLAWLQAQRLQAERAGQPDEAARLQRRIDLVLAGPATR